MAIVATEVMVHGQAGEVRRAFYRCQDHLGVWHDYGLKIIHDADFDIEGFKAIAAAKVETVLAEIEFNSVVQEME